MIQTKNNYAKEVFNGDIGIITATSLIAGLAVMIGYLVHLLGDLFTPPGVPLLFPLKFNARVPLVKTGGILERLVVFPASCVGVVYLTVIKTLFTKLWRY